MGATALGDPDYVSIYGLKPRDWYARGVRILGRTAVECTRDALASLIGRDVEAIALRAPDSYERGLKAVRVPDEELLIVFVAPPWGRALDDAAGLDHRQTIPPVSDVVDEVTGVFGGHKLLFATQVHETVNPDSLAEFIPRFRWSSLKVYEINAPGQNHGLLVGTVGWSP